MKMKVPLNLCYSSLFAKFWQGQSKLTQSRPPTVISIGVWATIDPRGSESVKWQHTGVHIV